jgi:hypothetical protein
VGGGTTHWDGKVPRFFRMNPTLTLMALALRNATALAHGEDQARRGPPSELA